MDSSSYTLLFFCFAFEPHALLLLLLLLLLCLLLH
jgi:hypothetical protein